MSRKEKIQEAFMYLFAFIAFFLLVVIPILNLLGYHL